MINFFFRYLDFINLMEYDYHGTWDGYTGLNAPLFGSPTDTTPEQKTWNIVSIILCFSTNLRINCSNSYFKT